MLQDTIHALILGIIQGLTEFLPVSSSAHLNLFPWIFNWDKISDSFDVALHLGTLLAIVLFFFKDWVILIKSGYNQVVHKKRSVEGRMFWYIVFATIPAGILSLILDKISGKLIGDNLNVEMLIIAITLIVMGVILYIVDKRAKSNVKYEKITFKQSMLIGLSQAIAAAFPGVSRSGITMTVARSFNIDREASAKYSFMLAAPITFAAVVFNLDKFTFGLPFLVGVIASFIVGALIIKFLLNYLKKGSFKVFAIYRVIIGLIVIGIFFTRI